MITRLEDGSPTDRSWNGRDDIHQHYVARIPAGERVLTLSLSWKKEKHSPLFEVGKFRFDMPRLVEAGYARVRERGYVIRFQRTGRRLEVAVNRSSLVLPLAPLPAAYFE